MRIRDILGDVLEGIELPQIGDLELGAPAPRLVAIENRQPIERQIAGWVARGLDPECVEAVLQRRLRKSSALEQVRTWHRSRNFAWIRILGGRGTGKSWAAQWWLMQGKQSESRLVTGAETSRWWPRDERWAELDTVPRLVIDDPDIQGSDPAPWFALMLQRHRYRRDTVLASNAKTREDFWAWWGESNAALLRSRWNEIGTAIEAGGEDMRVKGRDQ
jgi:hypothetical protein